MGIVHEHSIDWNSYKRHRILLLFLVVFFIPLTRFVSYLEVRLNLSSAVMALFVVGWILFIFWAGGDSLRGHARTAGSRSEAGLHFFPNIALIVGRFADSPRSGKRKATYRYPLFR